MSGIKDQLWKYLAKLGKKGPAEAKLAGELNKKMRHDILASFANKQDSALALKKLNAEDMPDLMRVSHPEIGYRQHSAALNKVWERTPQRELDQIGKWSAMGQPSAKKLDDWLLLNEQHQAKMWKELNLDETPVKRANVLDKRLHRSDKSIKSTKELMAWLKKRGE